SASTSLRRTFFPSQFRRTDSRTIRMLTGNREILPTPCSSSAGNEKRIPSRPLPASNFLSVLNSSIILLSFRAEHSGVEESLTVKKKRCLGFARHDKGYFNSASFALILSKL